ncbi:ornithine carbamoyltransferase [bacterium]|nr:ornithine carbamoyltransferase [bacterium]
MSRDFLAVTDFTDQELIQTLHFAIDLKKLTKAGECPRPFEGKSFGLIFHKPSLRTRMSFEVGINQLGGKALFITDAEIQLGVREAISDVARVLSRYLAGIVIRTYHQKHVEELAQWADIPVVNALTDLLHPCQIMGDLMTIMEYRGSVEGAAVSYLGDGNNVANSFLNAASLIPLKLTIACSESTMPNADILHRAQEAGVSEIRITHDPFDGVEGAEFVYGDVWASMGQKDKASEKAALLKNFQINDKLLKHAKSNVKVMHCLPAERGKEITDEVMDGPHSIVFDQAENRLHVQKAILMKIME